MNFTPSQLEAIHATGDTLVVAGAGTGKTRTLVERCVRQVLDETADVGLNEMLVVTFTEAAAAEIRQRIRQRLDLELERQPDNGHLLAQLASLETASVCTLHSFCLNLIRQHFHELHLDPQITVLAEQQTTLLADETLDELLEEHYRGDTPDSAAVRDLLREFLSNWEKGLRRLILHLHHFTQTRPDPEGWFRRQLEHFATESPDQWRRWLEEGFDAWRGFWIDLLALQPTENVNAHRCREILDACIVDDVRSIREALLAVQAEDAGWPTGKKTVFQKPIEKLFDDAAYLLACCPGEDGTDPLAADWDWVRQRMRVLVELAREFGRRFSRVKRERGQVDFHDLEQFALRLLWQPDPGRPSELARTLQSQLKQVYVDEYQDINEAQDTILTALSREGNAANRFLVGDVKQSIYRFRQAAPHVFQDYTRRWDGSPGRGKAVFLRENFRSHEGLLRFINALFEDLMKPAIGGVAYDDHARLAYGNPEERTELAWTKSSTPCVEVHLRLIDKSAAGRDQAANEDDASPGELSDMEREARLVATRLRQLVDDRHQVWDAEEGCHRDAVWSDMVVLLRSHRSRVETYAKEFNRLGVPLQARRQGFFESMEVQDLINLLHLLDNPLQDIPAVAVLRSPLAGLTMDELARVRLAARSSPFWSALQRWRETHLKEGRPLASLSAGETAMALKVEAFLSRFEHWRAQSRHASLSQRLEEVLNDTAYRDWLGTQDRAEQRQANVTQLLDLAREFDVLQSQGLHRFLRLIEAQQEAEADREPAMLETGNAVRLMSVHQSKGLEFPVVAVAGLDKRFNISEARSGVLLHDDYGLCPNIHPEPGEQSYKSLPLWCANRQVRTEVLGEEMRILYVALTRAQDLLILTGSARPDAALKQWPQIAGHTRSAPELIQANKVLDWMGPWLAKHAPSWAEGVDGSTDLFSWRFHREDVPVPAPSAAQVSAGTAEVDAESLESLRQRLTWCYPHMAATTAVSKSSVTTLRRQAAESDEEARPAAFLKAGSFARPVAEPNQLSAREVGLAHHTFLQWVDLEQTGSMDALQQEAARLASQKRLTPQESEALDLETLAAFWQSEVGSSIRDHAGAVRREWPFTARLSPDDLQALPDLPKESIPESEFVVVQGVADLVVVLPEETWLLDFKTDHFPEDELKAKVAHYTPQLRLYGLALNRILNKPVTKCWLHFLSLGRTVSLENIEGAS